MRPQLLSLLLFLAFFSGNAAVQYQYSVNCGGPGLDKLGWTSSSSTEGMTVRTTSGFIYKYSYEGQNLTALPSDAKYDPSLYTTFLWSGDDFVKFEFKVDKGTPYTVKLHFAEFSKKEVGKRVFDVYVAGELVLEDFDIFGTVKELATPLVKTFSAVSSGTILAIKLQRKVGNVLLQAIEIIPSSRLALFTVPPPPLPTPADEGVAVVPANITFGDTSIGEEVVDSVTITSGTQLNLTAIEFQEENPLHGFEFKYQFGEGPLMQGGLNKFLKPPVQVGPDGVDLTVKFAPKSKQNYNLKMVLYEGKLPVATLNVTGTGSDVGVKEGHTLHPIISVADPAIFIDWDGDKSETVSFNSSESHTHGPGRSLVRTAFKWFDEKDTVVATGPAWKSTQSVGDHTVVLLIYDDQNDGAAELVNYSVASADKVPGAWAAFYKGVEDLAGIGSTPVVYAEVVPSLQLKPPSVNSGLEPPYAASVSAQANIVPAATLVVAGGGEDTQYEVLVDDEAYIGGTVSGQAKITLNVLVEDGAQLSSPPTVQLQRGTAQAPPASVFHDQTLVQPVIISITPGEAFAGGEVITLRGLGFDHTDVTVTVGTKVAKLGVAGHDLEGPFLKFSAPVGLNGSQQVKVKTGGGRTSNGYPLVYPPASSGAVVAPVTTTGSGNTIFPKPVFAPVKFKNVYRALPGASTAVIYCFGYVFVAAGDKGKKGGGFGIYQFELGPGPAYVLKPLGQLKGSAGGYKQNGYVMDTILGLACDPWGSDDDFAVFATYNQIYPNGGKGNDGSAIPYSAAVVYFKSKENFAVARPAVANLPTSDHDHGVNAVTFLNTGELLISIGGDTNGGIPNPKLGNLADGPLSGAIVQALVKKPGYSPNLKYAFIPGIAGAPSNDPMDMRNKGYVKVVGTNVSVFASGFRNPFGLAVCASDLSIFATDNGPNKGFGGRMYGPEKNGQLVLKDPSDPDGADDPGTQDDRLVQLTKGKYYGQCNAARARAGADEEWYCYPPEEAASAAGVETQKLELESSSDGVACYRAEAFGGAAKDDLFIQAYTKAFQYQVVRQGTKFTGQKDFDNASNRDRTEGLGITQGPAGTLLVTQHKDCEDGCKLAINVPVDGSAEEGGPMRVYQIDPWRAPAKPLGPTTFRISGRNFPAGEACSVQFGTVAVAAKVVNEETIEGLLPTLKASPTSPYDVLVECDGKGGLLTGHFYALAPAPVGIAGGGGAAAAS